MTPPEEYKNLYERLARLCATQDWGDPFSYARSKEIYAAIELGHTVAVSFAGADAYNDAGQPVEYKSTTSGKVKGAYTGISVQNSWEEQVRYLREEKLAKYPEHFYNRFEGGRLVESWQLSGQQVFDILLQKLEKKYPTVLSKKDPRLSANITNTEINKYGKKVL